VRKFVTALAVLAHVSAGLIDLGLVGAFIVGIIRGSLSPWWFWPAGIVASIFLFIIGTVLLRIQQPDPWAMTPTEIYWDSPPKNQAVAKRSYRWGKTQGWITLGLAAIFLLIRFNTPMLLAAGFYAITAIGLIKRKKYGFVLVYPHAAFWMFLFVATVVQIRQSSLHFFVTATTFAAFWCIPAVFYYPRRWRHL
jgi:hypothetical protein